MNIHEKVTRTIAASNVDNGLWADDKESAYAVQWDNGTWSRSRDWAMYGRMYGWEFVARVVPDDEPRTADVTEVADTLLMNAEKSSRENRTTEWVCRCGWTNGVKYTHTTKSDGVLNLLIELLFHARHDHHSANERGVEVIQRTIVRAY